MFMKKLMRITAAILALSIMIGTVPAMGAGPQPETPRDPFEGMKDEYIDPSGAARSAPGWDANGAEDGAGGRSPGDPLREPDPNAGKTDRYLIKYRDGRRENFAGKASAMVKKTVDILSAEINMGTGAFGLNRDDERAPVVIPAVNGALENMELLILAEPMKPSEFASELKNMGAEADIEYIMPDVKLQLASS